ncbi:MAG: DNA gyrase subunit A [candidate division KSB1 bacterium]|nr:DNA gyrase subunit A [candidate division KSB1 bacterium]MDZ7335265.1 DNA gyrase subunit A [candidate division KSB1 bacterium]MDZ7399802.1 DNA gyrase subunit A [candidate division KSB1 bacterium]
MEIKRERVIPIYIEEEMKDSYIDYSMSVIVARALPDVRDGLKPVHRRVLYGMHELGLRSNAAYKKSARIVGEVLGKYHPHGDAAVYDTMVRMVQDFSLRYPLIDGQGNFGSLDGDAPAAMRYTEARMTPIAEELLQDIDKDTVDFVPNFDESLKEPTVLPSVLPNLLINGSSGIAVGMATNIPPHNLNEVIDALVMLIDKPDANIKDLMKIIKGPDFPTGAIIYGEEGIDEAYRSGRGRIIVRARANVETVRGGRSNIIVTEIPYMVNKANLIEKIAELVNEKKIEGISEVRDESDKDGLRIVIELKRDAQESVILNQLYRHTQMQVTFGVIMLALVDGVPQVLNLKQMLQHFINFRHDVVVRRTKFDLDKAEKKAHILEGLKKALDHIDEIIALIKRSKSPEQAKQGLMKTFKFSEVQAQAILDMRLQRLTGLERKKIEDELKETLKLISQLKAILENRSLRMQVIKEELLALKEKYGDARRTEIISKTEEFTIEDMIAEEDMVITISHAGFIKRFPVSGYRRQSRGGTGQTGATTKVEDFIEHLFIASTHHYILIFTNKGRCYWLKVYEIPQAGKGSKGRAIVNLIDIQKDEKIAAIVNVRDFDDDHYVVMATKKGLVKKTVLSAFGNPRKAGINAINIRSGDDLIDARLTDGNQEIVLGTYFGKAIRFHESEVRDMGRQATGVTGITLAKDDFVVGMVTVRKESTLLVITEKGYGKRTPIKEYRITRRGGKGIVTVNTTERVGKMISLKEVVDDDDVMIITAKGNVIRQAVKQIRLSGRATQGIRLIRLTGNDQIADVARIIKDED